MKLRSFVLLLSLIVPILFHSACQRGVQREGAGPEVALVLKTLNNPFYVDMEKGAREAAQKLRIRLVVQAPDREVDVEKQMQIVENLIQRRVAAICLAPCGSREIVPVIAKANRERIPVLILDTRVDAEILRQAGGSVTTFIGSDNFEGGRIAGEFIVKTIGGKGQVAILEGIPGHETSDERTRGFRKALSGSPGIEIVASQTANWERDQGFNVFQNILQSHAKVQALFACNDLMALGALEAVAAAGKTGAIRVVGFDFLADGREAIRSGAMDASIAQHPYDIGRLAVENAHRAIKGEPVPREIPVPVELITRTNVSESAGGTP
ncbi:MAG: D-ribose ABC transporter substrate-binding protein [Acidobacteria bacterium]|nr:MAG: D-ribose ABC transporter substrate-binding protein [Acidobacteriota bacterium]